MEVIRPGNPGGWSIEQTCTGAGNGGGGCQAVLRVSASDLYITSSNSYDGSSDSYTTFMCPLCGMETDVRAAIPSAISRSLSEPSRATVREWQVRILGGRGAPAIRIRPRGDTPEPEPAPSPQRNPRRRL